MRTRTLLLFSLILMMVAVSEIGVGFWPWENSAEAQLAPKGSVVGRLEIYPGVPITECFIKTVGDISDVPEGKCDESGLFYITPISTGVRRELIIENASGQVIKRIHTAVNPGFTTDLGTIVVFDPGMVTGRIIGADAAHLARLVVTVAGFPLATKPDAYGYYLLTNVPEGERKLVLHGIWWEHSRAQRHMVINVRPSLLTKAPDFVLKPPPPPMHMQQKPAGQKQPEVHPFPPTGAETYRPKP